MKIVIPVEEKADKGLDDGRAQYIQRTEFRPEKESGMG